VRRGDAPPPAEPRHGTHRGARVHTRHGPARYVRLTGWVQWIAGEKVMLVLDNGSGGVPVDLTHVPLDE
jgi:hypothetical protein